MRRLPRRLGVAGLADLPQERLLVEALGGVAQGVVVAGVDGLDPGLGQVGPQPGGDLVAQLVVGLRRRHAFPFRIFSASSARWIVWLPNSSAPFLPSSPMAPAA